MWTRWQSSLRPDGQKDGRTVSNRKAAPRRPARRNGRRRPTERAGWLEYVKFGAVVLVAAVYSYAVLLQPLTQWEPPPWPVFGSPLTRLASMAFQRQADDDHCGIPLGAPGPVFGPVTGRPVGPVAAAWPTLHTAPSGEDDAPLPADAERLYGAVAEEHLPWFADPPEQLLELRRQTGAHRLVSAFRTTLPNPIWDELDNVTRAARYLSGTVLQPGESRSLFAIIGPFTEARGYGDGPSYANNRVVPSLGGGVCKIATALYNVIVHSDLQVLERRPHSMLVPYVPPGRDAAIATGAKDVRFRNGKDSPVVIWAGMRDTTLFVALYGRYEPPVIEWFHEQWDRRRAEPVRRPNPALPSGAEQLVIEGYDGVTVRTWIIVKRPGEPDERRDLGVDTYRPLPGVVEYGP